MLSTDYPHLLDDLKRFRYGLMPIRLSDGTAFLIVKASKEAILAVHLKRGFRIYFLGGLGTDGPSHLGLVTAFFDDHDEPITLTTALFEGDGLTDDFVALLRQPEFKVYFVDEHDRDLLGVRVANPAAAELERTLTGASLAPFDLDTFGETIQRLDRRFSIRSAADDHAACQLAVLDYLYPEGLVLTHLRPEANPFSSASRPPAVSGLVREDPGPAQEHDIAALLGRVFPPDAIYLNPFRADTGKELCDVLVVTDKQMLFVEAKDSPNTARSLDRELDRKRQTIQNQIGKAVKQLSGALTYARRQAGVTITGETGPLSLALEGRQPLGLVVIREMFDDSQIANSAPILEAVDTLQVPLMLIDYPGLHMVTQNLRTPRRFIGALHNLFDAGLENGQFPRSVWSAPPLND